MEILQRLAFKSQWSESLKTSLKGEEAPLEKKRKERKEEEGLHLILNLIPFKNPKRAKENQKLSSSPHQISKGLLEKSKEDHLKPRKLTYNVFFKQFKAATSDN